MGRSNPEKVPDEVREQVDPRRAAKRLYDEMALAYHEQGELDLAISRAVAPTAVKSLRHEED